MNTKNEIFIELPCLTEKSKELSGVFLQKRWFKSADKRIIGQYIQKFVVYNKKHLDYLGIEPFITGTDKQTSIYFRSSNFIGTIPLRSPDSGKQIGDFVVTPRYIGKDRYSDYIKLLTLLSYEISPETTHSIPLISGIFYQPPKYLEASKFIDILIKLVKTQWRKFDRIEKLSGQPSGLVNWDKYITNEYKIENRLKFPTGKNVLTENHLEYSQIRYVYDICKKELLSINTPLDFKLSVKDKLQFINDNLYFVLPKATNTISIKNSDTALIKECKIQANKILNKIRDEGTAWRVDFANVFEKYTQYIFQEITKEIGGRLLTNFRLKGYSSNNISWSLKHIEPDAIFQKSNLIIFIDAKYKSHLFNKWSNTQILKDEHRHDLHQILSYCSFNTSLIKNGFLCYPSNQVELYDIDYKNPLNQTESRIFLLGIPLTVSSIQATKDKVKTQISNIEKSYNPLMINHD